MMFFIIVIIGDIWLLDLSYGNSEEFHNIRRAISEGKINETDVVITQSTSVDLGANASMGDVLNFLRNMGAIGGKLNVDYDTLFRCNRCRKPSSQTSPRGRL